MQERVITLATPVFFLLIAIELAVGWWRGRIGYRLNDATTSIGLGILSQIWGVFTRLFRLGIYAWVFQHVSLLQWPDDAWWALPAAVLLYDFCYYWHHRWMHRVAGMWAAHVVHHSSEDYNLSTALRQTGTGFLLGWIPYVPMAILGVPPVLFGIAALIDLLYQYWIHTEQVGRLGWFDRVFASPSNHRVHHGVNDRYVDRNYGGILIVWDRMFGTFVEERDDDPVVYGTRKPVRSFNPLWANFEVYAQLLRDGRATRRWRDRLMLWLRPPGWLPPDLAAQRGAAPRFEPAHAVRYDPVASPAVQGYALLQFAMVLAAAVQFLDAQARAPIAQTLAAALWITLSLTAVGMVQDGRRSGWLLDWARLALALACVAGAGRWLAIDAMPPAARGVLSLLIAGSLCASLWLSRHDGARPAVAPAAQPRTG